MMSLFKVYMSYHFFFFRFYRLLESGHCTQLLQCGWRVKVQLHEGTFTPSVLHPPPSLSLIKWRHLPQVLQSLPDLHHQRSTMKFVALALAVLLAAGCQARFLQADAPSQYEHIRASVVTYLNQVKDKAQKAIDHLDDGEFKDYKARLTQGLDNIETMLTSASASLAPVREGLGPQVVEAFSGIRERISHDLEDMRKELEPKREELRQVVMKHLEEYRTKLEPLLKEYSEKNRKQVDEFKAKFEPVIKELQEKIRVNVEETKSKLTPIVETIRNKLNKGLEELKATFGPHAQEYREQIDEAFNGLRKKYESGELQTKLKNLGEELRPQLKGIYDTVEKAFRA